MRTSKTPPPLGQRIAVFLSILGPGLIAAAAGNEAGGIVTYSNIGAAHGFSMLWLLVLSTFSLIVTQEMGARMGIVTGKGLADLIREEFGVRVAVFAMAVLFIANLATTVAEFAGIAAAFGMVPAPKFLHSAMLVIVAVGLWFLVLRGSYRRVERVFLTMCSVYIVYVVAALQTNHDWPTALKATLTPTFPRNDPSFIGDAIALIGTTIAPWMQFYVQSSVRDKGIKVEMLSAEKADVYVGSTLSNIISFFIVVACAATIHATHGPTRINTATDAAEALRSLHGFGPLLFGIGLFNASAVGAVIVPLSTAYAVTEAIGSESGLGRKVREAPLFLAIFTLLIAASTVIVLATPMDRLIGLINSAQILNGVLLPVILLFMLKLINTKRLMGQHANGPVFNAIAWITGVLVTGLSVVFLGQNLGLWK